MANIRRPGGQDRSASRGVVHGWVSVGWCQAWYELTERSRSEQELLRERSIGTEIRWESPFRLRFGRGRHTRSQVIQHSTDALLDIELFEEFLFHRNLDGQGETEDIAQR